MLSTHVGEIPVHVLSAGRFRLDGGAMYGVVPKVLWSRGAPADEHNRIELGLNCMLVEIPGGPRILVDTGMGTRWSDKERAQMALDDEVSLETELAELGLTPADVDIVVNSHLHFDHAGGNVRASEDGTLVPAFPEATWIVQAVEWDDAHHPHERNRASYRPDDFEPLEAEGRLRRVEGTAEVAPGVFVDRVPGHCPGMQVVRVESAGCGLVFPADLMPTAGHVRPAWNMAFDLDVTATVQAKKELLETVLEHDWLVCFDHEPGPPLVRLARELGQDGRSRIVTRPVA